MESPTTEHGSPAINGFGSGVFVGVGVGVADGVGVAVGDVEGTGVSTATPLFHTSFLPLLIHEYFFPPAVTVCPAVLQALPAFGAVAACAMVATSAKERSTGRARMAFLMPKP